jgi:hypothetical protein
VPRQRRDLHGLCELRAGFYHRHVRAEPPHGLRQFEADIAAAHHDEMLRESVEVECLDVGHRVGRRESRDVGQRRA